MSHSVVNQLENLGYDAIAVYGGCYKITQNGRIHYFSSEEGKHLVDSNLSHPIILRNYATSRGRNWWYDFTSSKTH